MKVINVIAILFIFVFGFLSDSAFALTISASASGSPDPGIAQYPETITNGDFLIKGSTKHPKIGDGSDETTLWTFDFTSDPFFDSFMTDELLTSAFLTITLTPYNNLITTDLLRVEGLGNITAVIQELPVGETATLEIELLEYYTSDQILGKFANEDYGFIPMFYTDDAILTYAQLDLSNAAVPEPSTLILLGLGLGMLGYKQKKLFRKNTV
jgi:hypothetical protein